MYWVRSGTARGLGQAAEIPWNAVIGPGGDVVTPDAGSTVYNAAACSSWGNWFGSAYCWRYLPSEWADMYKFGSQPVVAPPPAVTSTGVSETVPPTPAEAQAAIDASISQASAQTKANTLAAFQQMNPVDLLSLPGGGGGGGLGTFAVVALGLAAAGAVLLISSGRRGRR